MSLKRPRAAPLPVEALFLENSDSSSDDEPEEVFHSRGAAQSGRDGDDQPQMYASGGKMGKKRRDKHAPAEVSSKRRPSFLQNVVPVPKIIRRGARLRLYCDCMAELLECMFDDVMRVKQTLDSK